MRCMRSFLRHEPGRRAVSQETAAASHMVGKLALVTGTDKMACARSQHGGPCVHILPDVKRSMSVINELNDAVTPMNVLMFPMQFGPHSFSELGGIIGKSPCPPRHKQRREIAERPCHGQRIFHTGRRFSRNARGPSAPSSLSATS